MGLAHAIDTDTEVVEARLANGFDVLLLDQRAVGGQSDVEAQVLGTARDFEDVRTQQGLPAGQDQARYAEGLEFVHHREHLFGAQLPGKIRVGTDGVAVFATQIAAANQVPYHYRGPRLAQGRRRRWVGNGVHELGNAEHISPPVAGEARFFSGCGCFSMLCGPGRRRLRAA